MVPSILNCDANERRRRYRKALAREYMMLIVTPIKRVLPELADGIAAFITCALGFVVLAIIAMMI